MSKIKAPALPTMTKAAGEKQQTESIQPEVEVAQPIVSEIDPVNVVVELRLSPTFLRGANVKRHLNMTKRLTARQAKALRAIVNMTSTGRQTEAVQTLLDHVADAIESQCGIDLATANE